MKNDRRFVAVSVVALVLLALTSIGCQNTGGPMSPSGTAMDAASPSTPLLEARRTILDTINAGLVPNPDGGPAIFRPGVTVTPTPPKRTPREVPGKPPKTIPGKKPVQK